jgi:hypothetical protein
MANEAYIYRLRTDLPAGAIHLGDLRPNTSRRSLTYEKVPQSGYLPASAPGISGTNPTAAGGVTTNASTGLAAYLLCHTNDEVSGLQIGSAIAIAAETRLLARFAAGTRVTETEITADLVASGAGAGTLPFPALDPGSVSGAASVGTRAGFFKSVFSSFTYASGAQAGAVADGGAGIAADASSILDGSFDDDVYRQLYASGALSMSISEGDLSSLIDSAFSYGGVAGAACVVYGADGLVLS